MKKVRKEMREVEVEDYYAEVGDVITIPGKRGHFVVEEAEMTGGSKMQGYPDVWHVKARKLTNGVSSAGYRGKYNPVAKTIKFTQHTNCYNDVINGVEKVAQMKKVVDFRWVEWKK